MSKNLEITWQDIRLFAGEGKLSYKTVLQAANVAIKNKLPDLPDDFSESKDWVNGDYSDRILWLMSMVKNQREEIERISNECGRNIMNNVQCGNEKHPNGAWHEASPCPMTIFEQFIQWWRTKKYGCGCPVRKKTK